ncbi:MAG: flagellar biosynthetic protein FliO, partial [Deferrisomatales bacterium]
MRAAAAALLLFAALPAWAGRAVVDWTQRSVNVRSAPREDAPRVDRLAKGTEVETLGERGEWTRVRFDGGEGWVVSRSLRTQSGVPAAAPAPAPEAPTAAPAPEAPTPAQPPPSGPGPLAQSSGAVAPAGGAPPAPGGYLAQYADPPALPVADPGSSLLSLVSGLLLVLALLAGAVWAVRRFLLRGSVADRKGTAIRVLASRPLGPRQGLVLVEVGGLVWLLSQSPDGLSLVAEVRDPEALRRLGDRYGFLETPFEAELRQQLDLESAPAPEGPAPPGPSGPSPDERRA